jgi:hypothetical protein
LTVPWNLLSRLASIPHQHLTSILSRSGRRLSFPVDSRHPSPASFRRPEGLRRSACSRYALSDIPNRRERSSLSLTRRLARLPNALTLVIVPIPQVQSRELELQTSPHPEGHGAPALPEMFLLRGSSVLSYDSVSLTIRAFTFVSARPQRASHPLPISPSSTVTWSRGLAS